jgi:hypothetical protein
LQRTRLGDPAVNAAFEQQEVIGREIIDAEKIAPDADRPGGRGHVEPQRRLDLVEQVEPGAAFAVELVDKSMIGGRASGRPRRAFWSAPRCP